MGRNKGSQVGIIKTMPTMCLTCGGTFQILGKNRPDGPNPRKYCSQACYHAARRDSPEPRLKRTKDCETCGTPFTYYASIRPRAAYCSVACNNKTWWSRATPEVRAQVSRKASERLSTLTRQLVSGATPPLLNSDPLYNKLFMLGWKPARRAALERDGYACILCGSSTGKLNVHHVVPFRLVLKHELANLATLCTSCHRKVHQGQLDLGCELTVEVSC